MVHANFWIHQSQSGQSYAEIALTLSLRSMFSLFLGTLFNYLRSGTVHGLKGKAECKNQQYVLMTSENLLSVIIFIIPYDKQSFLTFIIVCSLKC